MSSWLTPDMVERHQHKSLMALPAIEAYVDSHGGFSVDEDQQGSHGNTNYVAFGHKDSQPAVFKYFFDPERREREVYGLRHWEATELVPEVVHDDGSNLLVQSRLILDPDQSGKAHDSVAVGTALGAAISRLAPYRLYHQDAGNMLYGGD